MHGGFCLRVSPLNILTRALPSTRKPLKRLDLNFTAFDVGNHMEVKMIEFVNVSKTYEDNNTHAVRNVSMKIDDGEFVFLTGVSGSGKSTILKLIMREQIPSEGDIIIDGDVINKLKRRRIPYLRRKMGMVYQDFRLIERMSVFNNVAFAVRAVGGSLEDIEKRVPEVIKMVGLENKMEERPSQLSGGEQQRVSLARALVNNPEILIADEPTANVDYDMSVEIIKILKSINENGTTVIVVTHDKNLVELFGGRVIELSQGSIVSDNGESIERSFPKKKNEEYDGSEEENLDSSAFDALIYEITQEFKISDLEISDSDKTD